MAKTYLPGKLYSSRDYSLFTKDPANRDVDLTTPRHKQLFASMSVHGFLPSHPIAVFVNGNGDLEIKRGQHRFAIAQKLGLPVYFVIDSKEIKSFDLESCGDDPWSHHQVATTYSCQGSLHYTELLDFAEETGFPIALSASLLMGTVSFGNIANQFRRGLFVVKDRKHAELVSELCLAFKEFDKRMTGKHLTDALAAAARTPDFDKNRLLKNLKRCSSYLKKYSNRDDFLVMLEDIYNFARHDMVPLKLNAIIAMRSRNAVSGQKTQSTTANCDTGKSLEDSENHRIAYRARIRALIGKEDGVIVKRLAKEPAEQSVLNDARGTLREIRDYVGIVDFGKHGVWHLDVGDLMPSANLALRDTKKYNVNK